MDTWLPPHMHAMIREIVPGPSGFITCDQPLTPDQAAAIKEGFKAWVAIPHPRRPYGEYEFVARIGQSRGASFLEICIGTAVGFAVAYAIQIILFPRLNINVSHETHILITTIFTAANVVRGYVMRRVFNWWHCRFG